MVPSTLTVLISTTEPEPDEKTLANKGNLHGCANLQSFRQAMIVYCAASLEFLDVKMHIERDAGAAVGAQKLRTRWGILVIVTNLGTVECPFVYQQDLVKQIRACPKIFGLLQCIFEEAANTRGNKSGSEAIEKFVVKRWYECFLVSLLPKRKAMLFTKPTRRYVCVKL